MSAKKQTDRADHKDRMSQVLKNPMSKEQLQNSQVCSIRIVYKFCTHLVVLVVLKQHVLRNI